MLPSVICCFQVGYISNARGIGATFLKDVDLYRRVKSTVMLTCKDTMLVARMRHHSLFFVEMIDAAVSYGGIMCQRNAKEARYSLVVVWK
jgi:hypothetical protein